MLESTFLMSIEHLSITLAMMIFVMSCSGQGDMLNHLL